MADPLVLLLPASGRDAGPLRDRIRSLGLRCEIAGEPPEEMPAGPVVMVLVGRPDRALAGKLPRGPGAPSPSRETPLLLLPEPGVPEPPPETEVDEILPAGAGDGILAGRLRTWGRWSSLARRPPDPVEGAAGQDHPASVIPGHKAFMETLGTEMKRHDRYDSPLGLVLGDIDGLREINSQYGHRTGDLVIRETALLLREAVRETDLVFHFAGDTFAIILTHSTAEATARAIGRLRAVVAGRIIRGLAEGGRPRPLLKISVSFGHATLPGAGVSEAGALVSLAEESLASLRQGGRGSAATQGRS